MKHFSDVKMMEKPYLTGNFFGVAILLLLCFIACNKEDGDNNGGKPEMATLSVEIGKGIEGYPSAGVTKYDTGMVVSYNYRALDGFINLKVTLDGKEIDQGGSFRIKKNHVLRAEAEQKILWQFTTNLPPYFCCPAIDGDKTLYVTTGIGSTHQGMLYALAPDGTLQWSYTHTTALFSPVISNNGNILVQDFYDKVICLSKTGSILWSYNQYKYTHFENVGQRCPAVAADGTLYVAGCGLHALDPLTGARKWAIRENFKARSSPSVGADGTVYITLGSWNMTVGLAAINPDSTTKWNLELTNYYEMSYSPPAIDRNGTVYLGAEGSEGAQKSMNVYAFDPGGSLKWRYPVDGERTVRASPVIDSNGNIIVATKANGLEFPAKVIALSPEGRKIWDYTLVNVHATDDDIYCTPAIDNHGTIWFAAETGFLYELSPEGKLRGQYWLPCSCNWSSPAISGDGVLYLGGIKSGLNDPGIFTAVKISGTGYSDTPWPRFRHDNANSGRY